MVLTGISGHTDNTEKTQSNLLLSQQKVKSVLNYLICKGVNSTNMTAKGYEDKPIAN